MGIRARVFELSVLVEEYEVIAKSSKFMSDKLINSIPEYVQVRPVN
jgi:hypothetical protein